MLTHPSDPQLRLHTYVEVIAGATSFSNEQINSVQTVTDWARNHLSQSFDGLGRRGAVCPFVKQTLETYDSFYITCLGPPAPGLQQIERTITNCRDWFEELEPADELKRFFKTIVIVLPTVPAGEAGGTFIDMIHQRLKPSFVKRKLMLGQFYPTCDVPGLHNHDFRPFQSPVSMFAIRHMQITDLGFLVHDKRFVRAYCEQFGVQNAEDLASVVKSYKIRQLPLDWHDHIATIFEEQEVYSR